ncbi:hypothetical protein ACILD7_02380 [Capnocytophaga canimorsus]|uniref:hypothetical protein n=1 Tax=Capnocytophaga canimorsus TaxID=28188 RepID=UPI0037CDA962
METLKDIFVSYDIAAQLEGIGFDEPCVAVYSRGKLKIFDPNDSVQWVMFEGDFFVPTWEQVKKWFRDKGYFSTIKINLYGFYYGSIGMHETIDLAQEDIYEKAREALILKLIEIYKNGK